MIPKLFRGSSIWEGPIFGLKMHKTFLSLVGTQKQQIKCTLHLAEYPNDQTKDCGIVNSYTKTTIPTEMAPKAEVLFG